MSNIRRVNLPATTDTNTNLHKIQRTVKWAVYIVPLVNFGLYVHNCWVYSDRDER